MIEWISQWAGSIIIAVVIGTIIEMILPEGNSKKYIKVVIGTYVLFTIVSPLITKFTGKNIEVSDVLELDKYIEEAKEASNAQNSIQDSNENNIMNIYSSSLKDDMKAKIEQKGYIVNSINIEIANDESYSILSINANIDKSNKEENNTQSSNTVELVENIEKVEINISEDEKSNTVNENKDSEENKTKDSLSEKEKKELKEYLSSVYEVNTDNITIN